MKKLIFSALAAATLAACSNVAPKMEMGNLLLEPQVSSDNQLSFNLFCQTDTGAALVLSIPEVGIEFASGLGQGLTYKNSKIIYEMKEEYSMVGGKRRKVQQQIKGRVYVLVDSLGREVNVDVRLSANGFAMKYVVNGLDNDTLRSEKTTYRIAEGTNRWMQRWTEGYEAFFPLATTGEAFWKRWGYPALIEPQDGIFALLTEANIERRQSASSLYNDVAVTDYRVCPDENLLALSGEWHSPWRAAIVGSLADVVKSTWVTDLSMPAGEAYDWVKPGSVSWIYWAYNHGSNDYNIITKYIDMAEKLGMPYMLIDAEWDEMKDGRTIEEVFRYAKDKNVRPLIWYNSSTAWIKEWGAPGPHQRLNKPEDREREFAWLEEQGVAGVKIDFFAGDKQSTMDYCLDLLECAARHHLLVNFHGATIPRGWQRTYPNLVSTEGVYGAEWYNNVPTFTAMAARHNATLPFTRNVVGPMDYTPCAFSDSQHPHITTNAHELALPVLYESTLQHWADKPESYYAQPQAVQDFIGQLPTVWDETKLVSGYPGVSAVLARRYENIWYVAGINGLDEAQTLALNWGFLGKENVKVTTFADSGNAEEPWQITTEELSAAQLPTSVDCAARGGFVMVIE